MGKLLLPEGSAPDTPGTGYGAVYLNTSPELLLKDDAGLVIKPPYRKGADVASNATINLDTATGDLVDVTGTTTITAVTLTEGKQCMVRFTGILTLTHGASLVLPRSGNNITTAAGDIAVFRGYAASVVRCVIYTRLDGSSPLSSGITLVTAQATTSGTSFDFTSIPAGVRRITLLFVGVSLSGTDSLLVQIGHSGGLETSSYVSTSGGVLNAAVSTVVNSTAGFILQNQSAGNLVSGKMVLDLVDAATFQWVSSHSTKSNTTTTQTGGGNKALSAELDRVRLLTTGADTFDAGQVNLSYEF